MISKLLTLFINILLIIPVASGYSITIIDPLGIHERVINDIISNTDEMILDEVDSITVIYNSSEMLRICNCTTGAIAGRNIYLMSSTQYLITGRVFLGYNFEGTLQHEFGHINGRLEGQDSEEYANSYEFAHVPYSKIQILADKII